ncbi:MULTISPECIES: cytochrome d ubiquinol oxidase subunit II [Pseudonocardia]|uniref:Cytochrome bd-I ubiquinol oxidase subunit 2 n=2 Tax=Pseudonocardia TaxID=1847 RepID=A0A1Y2N6R1_PSEAH|nr:MULTISPECIES: cytochrome d ubiquinol oxidase subunit II [Pseudonocardia]OSY43150.1 Cytochrome bd-I ubiquinol oxidase subunit 2 [Pseudonocardia autotrophica]TDN71638.1 cytochrome bd-I ubiquinol oxidase subunit 2 apoprotein [Pseudonocardia autotrophica]BBG02325.1 cytochrome c oxidase assembly protein [Pseudonocardia autotrophica]GEC23339.1 cytochrome c oxidase assembly protein [Pseudonocardia saturnea]
MDLPTVWFLAVAVLWTGYLVLEGFDFGVGMLLRAFGRTEDDREVAIGAIGPVWDGNEVWLIAAVGAMFAAFPAWYAATFSGFYLPVLFVLLALIVRGVGLEYRAKRDDAAWRARWDVLIGVGSLVPSFVWGMVLANLVRGLPTRVTEPGSGANTVVTASLGDLFNGYAVLGGVLTTALFLLHGAVFLALKTDGPVRYRARSFAVRAVLPVLLLTVAFLTATLALRDPSWTTPVAWAAGVALAVAGIALLLGREGWAFTATAATIGGLSVVLFGQLFPGLLVSSTDPAHTLTVANAASAPYTLTVMSWVAVVFLPLVLGYQSWSYWVFRKRLGGERIEPAGTDGPDERAVPAPR